MGGRGKHGKWFDGIGYLLKDVSIKNAYIVKSYIHGTSHIDYLRLLPGIRRLMPKIYVYFSPPTVLSNYVNSRTQSKLIKDNLERDYNNWVVQLKERYKIVD